MARNMGVSLVLVLHVVGLPIYVGARSFTVANNCPFTIWPGMYTDLAISSDAPDYPTGWQADPYISVSFSVPDGWKAGRIWSQGRRDCDFTVNPGPNSCLTGGCNGGLLCDATTGTGVPPVTVAEWTLQGDQNLDYYDVSLVDGADLPIRIDNNVGCPVADCPIDLSPTCPDPLKGPFDSTGYSVGCKSACFANLDGNQANSPNCCSGQFNTPATCPASGVAYYWYFKGNCPNAYAYAYDESSNTALWTCDSARNADYALTFCPSTTATAVAYGNSSVSLSATAFDGAGSSSSSIQSISGRNISPAFGLSKPVPFIAFFSILPCGQVVEYFLVLSRELEFTSPSIPSHPASSSRSSLLCSNTPNGQVARHELNSIHTSTARIHAHSDSITRHERKRVLDAYDILPQPLPEHSPICSTENFTSALVS
ncbi:hypothetical protein ACEPAF_2930 [Sanghuangporus sanghuang]